MNLKLHFAFLSFPIAEDVTSRKRCDWMKYRETTEVLFDKKVSLKV